MRNSLQKSFIHQMRCIRIFDKRVVLGLFALTILASSSALAAQLEIGIQPIATLYNSGRFPEALLACENAIKVHPLEPSLRYWHASILSKLQRNLDARQEFEYVYTYSKNKTERDYALKACQSLDAPVPPPASLTGTVVPYSPPVSVNPAVDRISRQADIDSAHILMDGTLRQSALKNSAAGAANLNSYMQDVDAMSRATISVGNKTVPRYTADEIQFARNQAIDRANQANMQNSARANEALQVAQQKAFETQASAANLAAQFNSGSKTGFHLREEGTNLYVRQYNAPSPGSSNSLTPAMVTIDDAANATRGKFDSPMQAKARALDPSLQKQLDLDAKKNVRSNVFGRLYPPDQNSGKH